ncbi:MAG: hypothetical protein PHH91_10850 [Desulfuromonadaceae bacterium]|nr:hypothetical protein [Desulfuromonadaceae bacterium]
MLTPHTTIISDNKTQPRAGRANLIGRMLRRDLSCLLVITLLLLSAISFSTEKIPNFKPDCETTSIQKSTSASPVAVVRCPTIPTAKKNSVSPAICLALTAPMAPVIELFYLPVASRAPPVFL